MKLKENFILEQIAGETVAIYCENNTVDFRQAISLKGSAEVMFKALFKDISREDLVILLTDSYDISKEQACEEVNLFLELLRSSNLLDG